MYMVIWRHGTAHHYMSYSFFYTSLCLRGGIDNMVAVVIKTILLEKSDPIEASSSYKVRYSKNVTQVGGGGVGTSIAASNASSSTSLAMIA